MEIHDISIFDFLFWIEETKDVIQAGDLESVTKRATTVVVAAQPLWVVNGDSRA
jgi:hypothetical protein